MPVRIRFEPNQSGLDSPASRDVRRSHGLGEIIRLAMTAASSSEQEWRPSHNHWAVALTVTLATFMEVLDTSIANVALPHIAGNLGASQDESTWVLTSYLVSNAVILPISAWLATRFGRKRFYMSSVALFTVSSFPLRSRAQPRPAGSLPHSARRGRRRPRAQRASHPRRYVPAPQRGLGFAVYGMAVVIAPAIGPTIGGWITDNYSWHWIFFINVPIGILSLFLTQRMVEDPPYLKREQQRVSLRKGGHRLHRFRADCSRHRRPPARSRQRPGRRLVLLPHDHRRRRFSPPLRSSPGLSGNGIRTLRSSTCGSFADATSPPPCCSRSFSAWF